MKKIWLVLIGVVVLIASVGAVGCGSDQVKLMTEDGELKINLNSQQEGIWVNGNGKIMATPDIALLSLGIEETQTRRGTAAAGHRVWRRPPVASCCRIRALCHRDRFFRPGDPIGSRVCP